MSEKVRVVGIFNSIDGEVNRWGQGTPTTFIRFAGCIPPYCILCDTPWSQRMDAPLVKEMTVEEIVQEVQRIGCPKVTITGGEPLLQMDGFVELIKRLGGLIFSVSVETSGLVDLPRVGWGLKEVGSWVVDWKMASSGRPTEQLRQIDRYEGLRKFDWVKFIVGSESECGEAMFWAEKLMERCQARFALSPVMGIPGWGPAEVVRWVQNNRAWHFALFPSDPQIYMASGQSRAGVLNS